MNLEDICASPFQLYGHGYPQKGDSYSTAISLHDPIALYLSYTVHRNSVIVKL